MEVTEDSFPSLVDGNGHVWGVSPRLEATWSTTAVATRTRPPSLGGGNRTDAGACSMTPTDTSKDGDDRQRSPHLSVTHRIFVPFF